MDSPLFPAVAFQQIRRSEQEMPCIFSASFSITAGIRLSTKFCRNKETFAARSERGKKDGVCRVKMRAADAVISLVAQQKPRVNQTSTMHNARRSFITCGPHYLLHLLCIHTRKKNYRERRRAAPRGDIYYQPPAADINITHKRAGDNKMHISNWCAKNYAHIGRYRASRTIIWITIHVPAILLSLKFQVMNIGATRHSYFFLPPSASALHADDLIRAERERAPSPVRLLICKQQSTITDIIICSASHNIIFYIYRRRSLRRSFAADQECAARARPGLRSPLINRINHSQSAFPPRFALATFASSAKCAANPQISFLWHLRFVNNPRKRQIKGEIMPPCGIRRSQFYRKLILDFLLKSFLFFNVIYYFDLKYFPRNRVCFS